MCCLFYTKSKTLSHLRESLTLYKDAISENINSKDKQYILLNALYEIWGHSTIYLKFCIEFLLNNNLVEHGVVVSYIFEKMQKDYISGKGNNSNTNYFGYYLVDFILCHCNKSSDRLKKELSKEQANLSKSDETMHSIIIKSIENYEDNIERMTATQEGIFSETFTLFNQHYYNLKTKNADVNLLTIVNERMIEFVRKNRNDLVKHISTIKANGYNENFEDLVLNMKNI